jgi:hypothetical protein
MTAGGKADIEGVSPIGRGKGRVRPKMAAWDET